MKNSMFKKESKIIINLKVTSNDIEGFLWIKETDSSQFQKNKPSFSETTFRESISFFNIESTSFLPFSIQKANFFAIKSYQAFLVSNNQGQLRRNIFAWLIVSTNSIQSKSSACFLWSTYLPRRKYWLVMFLPYLLFNSISKNLFLVSNGFSSLILMSGFHFV